LAPSQEDGVGGVGAEGSSPMRCRRCDAGRQKGIREEGRISRRL
jgi:hypothetical protein